MDLPGNAAWARLDQQPEPDGRPDTESEQIMLLCFVLTGEGLCFLFLCFLMYYSVPLS